MLSLLPWDSKHVRWLPCKDVPILLEEGGECAFLRRVEAGPDHGGLVRLIVPEDDVSVFTAKPAQGYFLALLSSRDDDVVRVVANVDHIANVKP